MTERLIDLLRARYAARKRRVEFLGREVFVSPLTVQEQMRIAKMHPDDDALRMVEMVIAKAVDADGKPVFTLDDKQELKRGIAMDDIMPLVAAINGPSPEEQEKN